MEVSLSRYPFPSLPRLVPGVALSAAVSALAMLAERAERALTGHAWIEALVLAILIGTLIRTAWRPPAQFEPGIQSASKTVLEAAVAMLGATVSFGALMGAGVPLIGGIAAIVAGVIAASYLVGRLFGLPRKMAMLVACGNAICGNSAIAAVAPVIDAECDDVAAAIAFTAVLGVAVVLLLPVGAHALGLGPVAGGALAGLTVYAVPQVIAAAAPMGGAAVQLGTLVKLIRVLMLGPVVATLSLLVARNAKAAPPRARRFGLFHFLPWFILAFLALAALNSAGLVPDLLRRCAGGGASLLTVVAMAGLGLGVDLRSVTAAGPRVTAAVVVSLAILTLAALALLRAIGLS